MSGQFGLIRGKQMEAATLIADELPTVTTTLETTGTQVQEAMTGWIGGAASGFAEAISAWFEKAALLPVALADYATQLGAVDSLTVEVDNAEAEAYVGSGGSGLNMAE